MSPTLECRDRYKDSQPNILICLGGFMVLQGPFSSRNQYPKSLFQVGQSSVRRPPKNERRIRQKSGMKRKSSMVSRTLPRFVFTKYQLSTAKRNELGVQLLSRPLHSQVFRDVTFPPPDPTSIQISREHLGLHGLDPTQGSVLPDTSFTLPPIQGNNLDEHFYRIGTAAAEPWISLSKEFARAEVPPKPEHWEIQSGWTKYYHRDDGSSYFEHVESLETESVLCFDVETMPEYHPFAVMATAVSKDAWYAWISPWLLEESTETRHLIPIGNPTTPRVVVGHNVSYDRGRILEEYTMNGTQTRFVDTMALHIAVKGISSHQRPAWMKHRKNKEIAAERYVETVEAIELSMRQLREAEALLGDDGGDLEKREGLRKLRVEMEESLPQLHADTLLSSGSSSASTADLEDGAEPNKRWEDLTSVNSLADVAKLHCNIDMDKEIRNDFMTSTPSAIRASIHSYLDYCAHDVFVTHSVFAKALPAFLSRCPNPVSFAGILTMGSSFLTVNESWEKYLMDAERTYKNLENSIKKRLLELCEQAKTLAETEEWKDDPWLSQLDWTPKAAGPSRGVGLAKLAKQSTSRSKTKKDSKTSAPKIQWPKWYWDLTKPKKDMPPGTVDITVRSRISPILLRLSWLGWPLFHSREHGWTFRVPKTAGFSTRLTELQFYDPADDKLHASKLHDGFVFYKLPHKDGEKANVGNPLAKTFIKFAQDGTLTSPGDEAKEALDMNAQCSYWISSRDRILKQNVVWQDEKLDMGFRDLGVGKKWGVIIPQLITMGTVTRRAIEKTWLTASNAKKNRVGSELKAMVRAPDGYAIVGADVDSEELWISSCMGDAQFGLHGATAIGWMTLEGTKAAGTDLHSKTAKILGISRDQAKVFNYSRIYGAGMRHAVLLLLQSNAGMLPEQAQKLSENLYNSTKGKSTHRVDMFGRKFWFGGTETYLFNKLEEIALSDRPQTPALGCGVTDALSKEFLPAGFGTDYMTSRINWVVQSSGVDYLHMLIVSMDHLIAKYDIKARYLISVHDELRYLVREEDKYRAALALQIANLWTRCLFAYKLGMDDLPQGVAFFSAVDVDKVLRKEVYMPCVTPSHPDPIPAGESLDITQILEKTGGGTLRPDGGPMTEESQAQWTGSLDGYQSPDCLTHRAKGAAFLRAQATTDFAEVKALAQMDSGQKFEGGIGGSSKLRKRSSIPSLLADVEGVDWTLVNEVLKTIKLPTTGGRRS